MWKKIESLDLVITIKNGDIVSQFPDNYLKHYSVLSNDGGYAALSHVEGIEFMEWIAANRLCYDNWWVKK